MRISGRIIKGHGVASGTGRSRYPAGTLSLQKPFFQKDGLDLSSYYEGTLNIDIAPHTFEILEADYVFKELAWIDSHQPETFLFCSCGLTYNNVNYNGLIYYPSPETKERHFQPPTVLEVLAPPVKDISYGAQIELTLDESKIRIV